MRYSHYDLELSYEYHTEQPLGPNLHWTLQLLGTGTVLILVYNLLIYVKQPVWPWSILLLVLLLVSQFFQASAARVQATYAGIIRLKYTAGEACCYFSPVKLQEQATLPLGPELPLSSIHSIQVRELASIDPDEPSYGLVEVQLTKAGPWLLFAQLPTIHAARQAATLLRDLIGLPEITTPDPPLAPGISFLHYLGRQYYKLSHGKLR
ncbi:hypothetical protein [Hymenobacter cellulosilyticus]|uniref:Uncharacterized protein n=1 Tax=Hymenobacter cellulosilyticus TaxID=2932248 RepID=A0A8T9Q2J5_9BACT|nr:hypothetical protein [Hymenobacter cellulosilyticus]UOQ71172.1 hypothetical protein MUN79_21305 [Hymenobacter cellulosilyticus]